MSYFEKYHIEASSIQQKPISSLQQPHAKLVVGQFLHGGSSAKVFKSHLGLAEPLALSDLLGDFYGVRFVFPMSLWNWQEN